MTKMDEKANGWLEKVNAKFFCGVDFFKFGVLTETWFEAKFWAVIAQKGWYVQEFGQKMAGVHRKKLHKRSEMCKFFA